MKNLLTLKNKIQKLGLGGELIGSWLWVECDSIKTSLKLKEMGFKYSQNKNLWFYTDDTFGKPYTKVYTIDEIRCC